MIELIDGNIYSIDEKDLSQHILNELLAPEHENDVICVLKEGIRIYINAEDVSAEINCQFQCRKDL